MKYAAIAALIAVVSATDCPENIKMEYFTDKECKTEDEDNDTMEADATLKANLKKGGCVKKGDNSVKMECDAKGVTTTVYMASTECKKVGDGADPEPTKYKYTACKKVTVNDHTTYLKLTGAAALKAAAIALVAIAGSQF